MRKAFTPEDPVKNYYVREQIAMWWEVWLSNETTPVHNVALNYGINHRWFTSCFYFSRNKNEALAWVPQKNLWHTMRHPTMWFSEHPQQFLWFLKLWKLNNSPVMPTDTPPRHHGLTHQLDYLWCSIIQVIFYRPDHLPSYRSSSSIIQVVFLST